jgi:hypothetical protein
LQRHHVFRHLLGIVGLLFLASPLVSQTGDWGEPVEGIQMRLAESKAALPRAGELPQFEVQLRNSAEESVPISLSQSTIEIDGIRYGYGPAPQDNNKLRPTLAPGAETDVMPILFGTPLYELNDLGGPVMNCRLRLRPGKHTVQVKLFGSIIKNLGNGPMKMISGTTDGLLKSNTITIDTPRTSGSESPGPQSSCAPQA